MKTVEFVSLYDEDMTPDTRLPPELHELEHAAICLGAEVHSFMRGYGSLQAIGAAGFEYSNLITSYGTLLRDELTSTELQDKPDSIVYSNIAGHMVQNVFNAYYYALREGDHIKPNVRDINVNRTELSLALQGTWGVVDRARLSRATFKTPNMPFKLFSDHFRTFRNVTAGTITEVDGLQIGLQLARENPGIIVIPSPPQFERGHGVNSDLLLIDTKTEQTVGIQMKTTAREYHVEKYKGDAVKLVSGDEDLDNYTEIRTHPRSSRTEGMAWPGYISLHRLSKIALTSASIQVMNPFAKKQVLRTMQEARTALGETAPRFRTAKQRVGQRVLPALDR